MAFKEFESAELCVEKMNGRWYAQRQLDVSLWDGLTNYQVEETDQEREQRIEKWEKFLDTGGGEGLKDTATSTTQVPRYDVLMELIYARFLMNRKQPLHDNQATPTHLTDYK